MKNNQAGFAFIGSLIIASLTTVLLSVAQKVTAERRPNTKPADAHLASILAEQKLRELNAESLSLSPDSALLENVSGYVEYLDKKGVPAGRGRNAEPPHRLHSPLVGQPGPRQSCRPGRHPRTDPAEGRPRAGAPRTSYDGDEPGRGLTIQ